VGVQALVLHAFCALCCISALCCFTLGALFLVWRKALQQTPPNPGLTKRCLALWLAVALSAPLGFGRLVQPKQLPEDFDYSRGHILGKGPLKVAVFSDFQCPYCRKLFLALFPVAQQHQELITLCYRDFPMPLHERALPAAAAADAAGLQGHYWDYSQLLYQGQLDDNSLRIYAGQLGLDVARFDADRRSQAIHDEVAGKIEEARQLQIAGVPACFVEQKQRPADASVATLILEMLNQGQSPHP
jgi:hypothetical protein